MEIKTDDYSVIYNAETATIFCKGSLLLTSEEYAPILQLLNTAAEQTSNALTLNVKELEFLNSSGINTFTKFVVHIRRKQKPQLVVVGHGEFPWHVRFLKNMQRLLPALTIKLEN